MDRSAFLSQLDSLQPKLGDTACDLVPTSFEANDPEIRAFPLPLERKWSSAERALKLFGGSGVMMRLPLFWQVEPALFAAAQNAGAFIFVNDQDNMPLGAAALRDASIHTVVTTTEDAHRFCAYLNERNAKLPAAWIIVHRIDQKWDLPAAALSPQSAIAQEVHLFPGVPVLEQCDQLIEGKRSLFHLVDGYELADDGVSLSGRPDDIMPFSNLELGTVLHAKGTCSCGKALLIS